MALRLLEEITCTDCGVILVYEKARFNPAARGRERGRGRRLHPADA